jgi:hypothetical protein
MTSFHELKHSPDCCGISGSQLVWPERRVFAKQPGRFGSISELRGSDLVDAVVKETLRLIEGIEDRHELLRTGDR